MSDFSKLLQAIVDGSEVDETNFKGLSPAVAAGMEKALKTQQEHAAEVVAGLLGGVQSKLHQSVAVVREARKAQRKAKAELDKIDRAVKYFMATSNILPYYKATGNTYAGESFCIELGIPVPDEKDPAWDVPKDFTPEVE